MVETRDEPIIGTLVGVRFGEDLSRSSRKCRSIQGCTLGWVVSW